MKVTKVSTNHWEVNYHNHKIDESMTANIKPQGKSCVNVENIYSSKFSFFSVKNFTIDIIEKYRNRRK